MPITGVQQRDPILALVEYRKTLLNVLWQHDSATSEMAGNSKVPLCASKKNTCGLATATVANGGWNAF